MNDQLAVLPDSKTGNDIPVAGLHSVFSTHNHSTNTTTNTILTAEQLSEVLPLHPETIRRWAREGRIPHRRLGRKIVFLRGEIDAWIASGRLFASVMSPNPERMAA